MSDFNRDLSRPVAVSAADMAVDAGLRAFMLGVYNKVGLGLVLSAAMAYLTGTYPPVRDMLFPLTATGARTLSGLGVLIAFAPLAIILFSGFLMRSVTPRSSAVIYWSIVALMGASMGLLVIYYSGESIATTFMITAAAFGSLSLAGYVTKRNLDGLGSFLIMGLFGLLIAMVVNMFVASSGMAFVIDCLGVLIFAGLIAYDTQRLKLTYYRLGADNTALGVATNYGALSLYLDFINLFRFLLSLLGGRR